MRARSALIAATVMVASIQAIASGGPVAATPATPVDRAWSWIQSQLGTGTPLVGDDTAIAPDLQYPASWTGAVSGSFAAPAGAPFVPAAVAVTGPPTVPGTYGGVVQGRVTLPPQVNRWIIQVYRDSAAGRAQVPLQALAAPDGSFVIDLAAAGPQPSGTWAIGVLDAQMSYAPAGVAWPDPGTYTGWSVRALVTTDVTYLIGSVPAAGDDRFAFPASQPGTKTFQLVDPAGTVHAEAAPDLGLVRSFGSPGGTDERSYTYDQAMALITAIGLGESATAARLTTGLLSLQSTTGATAGGFVEVAAARNPYAARPVYRAGISAFATYALLTRLSGLPVSDASYPAVAAATASGVGYLISLQRPDGLIAAGSGAVRPDGSIDPAAIGWVSTEHALDSWHALQLAATVLSGTAATAASSAAAALKLGILSLLWNGDRFRQGLASSGAPDDTDALDANSWGAVFLIAIGRADLGELALDHVALFAATDAGLEGFRPFYPQATVPSAPSVVWLEGTAGVALAQQRIGRASDYDDTVAAVSAAQRLEGSLPYASSTHTAAAMTTSPSVCASAWFIVAALDGTAPVIWS